VNEAAVSYWLACARVVTVIRYLMLAVGKYIAAALRVASGGT
jgi:hypothetical protein